MPMRRLGDGTLLAALFFSLSIFPETRASAASCHSGYRFISSSGSTANDCISDSESEEAPGVPVQEKARPLSASDLRQANALYFGSLRDFAKGDPSKAAEKLRRAQSLMPGNRDLQEALDRMRREIRGTSETLRNASH